MIPDTFAFFTFNLLCLEVCFPFCFCPTTHLMFQNLMIWWNWLVVGCSVNQWRTCPGKKLKQWVLEKNWCCGNYSSFFMMRTRKWYSSLNVYWINFTLTYELSNQTIGGLKSFVNQMKQHCCHECPFNSWIPVMFFSFFRKKCRQKKFVYFVPLGNSKSIVWL